MRPSPISIPVSSLLPPVTPAQQEPQQLAGPSRPLRCPSYVLGPLPTTAPVHLALDYLKLYDAAHDFGGSAEAKMPDPAQNKRRRQEYETGDGGGAHAVQREDVIYGAEAITREDGTGPKMVEGRGGAMWKGKGKEEDHPGGVKVTGEPIGLGDIDTGKTTNYETARGKARVTILTGPKSGYTDRMIEEDEDWLRVHGGYFEVLGRLKRVDIRYCPSLAHLKLLLNLLSETSERHPNRVELHHTPTPSPGLIILWNVAEMLMREDEVDENEPPPLSSNGPGHHDYDLEASETPSERNGVAPEQRTEGPDSLEVTESDTTETKNKDAGNRRFKDGVCISDYMDILAAARAAIDHLSSLHPARPPVQLAILEPSLTPKTSLPILPPLSSENEDPKMTRSNRERRIDVIDCARRLFGREAIGVIEPISISGEAKNGSTQKTPTSSRFSLRFEGKDGHGPYEIIKGRCDKAPAAQAATEIDGSEVAGESQGAWRWEWSGGHSSV